MCTEPGCGSVTYRSRADVEPMAGYEPHCATETHNAWGLSRAIYPLMLFWKPDLHCEPSCAVFFELGVPRRRAPPLTDRESRAMSRMTALEPSEEPLSTSSEPRAEPVSARDSARLARLGRLGAHGAERLRWKPTVSATGCWQNPVATACFFYFSTSRKLIQERKRRQTRTMWSLKRARWSLIIAPAVEKELSLATELA